MTVSSGSRAAAPRAGVVAPAPAATGYDAILSSTPVFITILVMILVIAALPRITDALRTPLIFDEIYGVHLARLGFAGTIKTLAQDVDQPLNFLVIGAWRALGGEGDFWLRIPSLVFALSTIAVTAVLGRAMFGAPAGLLGAALLALHPTHVAYSHEARFHALVWFLLAALIALGWRWVERPGRWTGLGLALISAATLYTDWYSAFPIGAVALWGCWELRHDPRRLGAWLGVFALGLLLYVPQLVTLSTQLARDIAGERRLRPMDIGEIREFLRKLSCNATYMIPVLIALAVIPVFRARSRRPALYLWFVALFCVLVPWALSVAGIHIFITRQMLFVLPLWCLLIATAATGLGPVWARGLLSLLMVAFVARTCWLRTPAEETRLLPLGVAELRDRGLGQGGLVVSCETRAFLFVRHYLPGADSRLLIMPDEEPFHYSDGVLIVPESQKITPDQFRARARHESWGGIRLPHAGRDGPKAAAMLNQAPGVTIRHIGRLDLWEAGPVDSSATH